MDRPRRATFLVIAATSSALVGAGWVRHASLERTGVRPLAAAQTAAHYPPRLLDLPAGVTPIPLRFATSGEDQDAVGASANEHASQPAQWQSADLGMQRLPFGAPVWDAPRMASFPSEPLPHAGTITPPLAPPQNGAWRMPDTFEFNSSDGLPDSRPVQTLASPSVVVPRSTPISQPQQRLAALEAQVTAQVQKALSLADRGASYSARVELFHALQHMAQTLDAAEGTRRHRESLAAGLRALEEGEDFQPHGVQLATPLDLEHLIAAHRTPVLKNADLTTISPLEAMQAYYTFAQEQLAAAVDRQRPGSLALFVLGKLYGTMGGNALIEATGPKSMVFYQAAMLVDPQNHLAANELGVLLARYEQWDSARSVLRHSLHVCPTTSAWHNLAIVHERLGENELANLARRELEILAQKGPPAATSAGHPPVRWLTPDEFARTFPPEAPMLRSPTVKAPSASQSATIETAWWDPWGWFK